MTPHQNAPQRILVIDDESSIRAVVNRLLARGGYETLLAPSGDEGLRLFDLHAAEIGLVLLDWKLPGTSGADTLAALLARRPDLRVILVTGAREATMDEHATKDTVSILLKPFTPTELMLAVRTVMGA